VCARSTTRLLHTYTHIWFPLTHPTHGFTVHTHAHVHHTQLLPHAHFSHTVLYFCILQFTFFLLDFTFCILTPLLCRLLGLSLPTPHFPCWLPGSTARITLHVPFVLPGVSSLLPSCIYCHFTVVALRLHTTPVRCWLRYLPSSVNGLYCL